MRKIKKFTRALFVFLSLSVLCLAALLTAACTSKPQTLGQSLELKALSEESQSWVVFKVTAPLTVDEKGNVKRLGVRLHDVYIHASKICSEEETATLELQWGASKTPAEDFFTLSALKKAILFNPDYVAKEGDTPMAETDRYANYIHEWQNKWVTPFGFENLAEDSPYRDLTSDMYFRLVLPRGGSKYLNSDMVINEIVFVGEVLSGGDGTGEYVVLPAEIDMRTYLPDDKSGGTEKAKALLDAQQLPKI